MLARAGEGFAIRTAEAGTGMTWTKERIELLTKLWTEGLSASQIAAELGGDVSRNAVISKAHRLGLTHGPAKASSAPRPCKPRMPEPAPGIETFILQNPSPASMMTTPQPAAPPAPVPPREGAVATRSEGVTIMELREFMCRWVTQPPPSSATAAHRHLWACRIARITPRSLTSPLLNASGSVLSELAPLPLTDAGSVGYRVCRGTSQKATPSSSCYAVTPYRRYSRL